MTLSIVNFHALKIAVIFFCSVLSVQPLLAVDEENVLSYQVEKELPLLSRLGLWNGSDFDEMSESNLPKIKDQNLYFITHGWAPDQRPVIKADPSLRAWSPGLTEKGRKFGYFFYDLAPVILEYDPTALVFAFSWVDDAATDNVFEAYQAEARAVRNGQRLGAATNKIVAADFSGNLTFMGHSHGAKVAAVAAGLSNNRPRQLTLFDSPESDLAWFAGASNNLLPYLRKLKPGRSPDSIFVQNYISEFGRRYGIYDGTKSIVDVKLDPVQYSELDIRHRHGYPLLWYAYGSQEANNPGAKPIALKRSPIYANLYLELDNYYLQDWTNEEGDPILAKQYDLLAQGETNGGGAEWQYRDAFLSDLSSKRGNVETMRNPAGQVVTWKLRTTKTDDRGEEELALWHGSFEKDASTNALRLEYHFTQEGDRDEFAIWIDDILRFVVNGVRAGNSSNFALIDLDGLATGRHQITLALHPCGNRPAEVIVKNPKFVTIP